jgi:capsular polysaccharide transport system permease protein
MSFSISGLGKGFRSKRQDRPRGQTMHVGLAFVRWVDSVTFMVVNDFGDRYRQSKMSAFFTVFEPLGLITVLSLAQIVAGGGSLWDDANFHTTGVLPYYLFFHITLRMRASEMFMMLPRVTRFDQILSHLLSEWIAKSAISAALFMFFAHMGVRHAVPYDWGSIVPPVLMISLVGVGVGLINVFISFFFAGWNYLYAIVARAMMALSGIITRPDMMPVGLRHFVEWNPLFQAVTWFRLGFFPGFPSVEIHRAYLIYFTFGILAFGLLLTQSLQNVRNSR